MSIVTERAAPLARRASSTTARSVIDKAQHRANRSTSAPPVVVPAGVWAANTRNTNCSTVSRPWRRAMAVVLSAQSAARPLWTRPDAWSSAMRSNTRASSETPASLREWDSGKWWSQPSCSSAFHAELCSRRRLFATLLQRRGENRRLRDGVGDAISIASQTSPERPLLSEAIRTAREELVRRHPDLYQVIRDVLAPHETRYGRLTLRTPHQRHEVRDEAILALTRAMAPGTPRHISRSS